MKIGIIGAGFTGIAAAYELVKQGHIVTIFEKDKHPGGLALGYKEKQWEWSLEKHYHHWFTNDAAILDLAKEIGHTVLIKRPKTSAFIDRTIYQLDSPQALLRFPKLSIAERLRMAAVLAFLKINPFWKPLEKINANAFLTKAMGKRAYQMLWEPQLRNKMGKYADVVSLVWFWSRIKKRTSDLAYPHGGFLSFADALVQEIQNKGGSVLFETETVKLTQDQSVKLTTKDSKQKQQIYEFDRVIVTVPSFLFLSITPQLPDSYKAKLAKLKGIGATNLVLRLQKPFLKDGTYWLSICEKNAPIMVIVEHTNFMDKKYFNNEHLVYLGNYPAPDSPLFQMDKAALLTYYDSFLKRINKDYRKSLIDYDVFKAPFAQPIIPKNYSSMIPPFETPLPHVYLANIEQVYPWDRGTNYAVALGKIISKKICTE